MKQGVDYIGVAVGALIINDKGEIFITKRSQQCKNERGSWEIPGGSVEFGETLEDAVKREVKEEYGVEVDIIKQWPAVNHLIPNESQHWVPTLFTVRIKPGQVPRIMEPTKCDAIGWFSINNLPSPLSIVSKIDLDRYIKEINKAPVNHEQCPICKRYDNRGVSVDALVVHKDKILLIKRGVEPHKGKWGTPGGYVGWDESAEEAVLRELKEETGLTAKSVQFLAVRSNPNRHPNQVITFAYRVEVESEKIMSGDDAVDIGWFPLSDLPVDLAFDHVKIIKLFLSCRSWIKRCS